MPTVNSSSGRSTFLTILLLMLCSVGVFVGAVVLLGPIALSGLALAGLVCGIGFCHYLLWGRSMNREVELARSLTDEEPEAADSQSNGWPTEGPHGPRRF